MALRTPALPYAALLGSESFHHLFEQPHFLEALYLASPVLYDEYEKLRNGQVTDEREKKKIEISLARYYQRMCSRPTPFGLFSGCGITQWSDTENTITVNTASPRRHTRLDMHYACALAQHLAAQPFIRERLLFYPNNSLYDNPSEIRYIDYYYKDGKRIHQVSAITRTPYLDELMQAAATGIRVAGMKQLLMTGEIAEEEATDYINEVLAAQLLVSELEPAITGTEFTQQIIDTLTRINQPADERISEVIVTLTSVEKTLLAIDRQAGNDAAVYRHVMQQLQPLGIAFEANKLFQTDLVLNTGGAGLSSQYQQSLQQAFTILCTLWERQQHPHLNWFMRRFNEQYEGQELPLLQVLDAETGIGYPENSAENVSPLLQQIAVQEQPAAHRNLEWHATDEWLQKRLFKALRNGDYEITVEDEELKALKCRWEDCPPSLTALFQVVENDRLLIGSISGSSTAALLGRFGYGEPQLAELVNSITQTETELNSGICFAEIIHLPESRIGNILLHPVYRSYEIPYLAASSLPQEQQLLPSDLRVSVKNNRIILRSAKLDKEIIPRLSSAHNFSYNSLPVYRFLCDLQTQHLRGGFGFSWGQLSHNARFQPRVRYKNIILQEAGWFFSKEEIAELLKALKEKDAVFLQQWKLPACFLLVDGDNELLVNTRNPLSVSVFEQTVRNRNQLMLKEWLAPAPIVQNEASAPMTHQFAASFVKTVPVYEQQQLAAAEPSPQRSFVPGSEWLYYKIYCGAVTSEGILEQELYPVIKTLLADGLIDQWFFIRYADPQFHLRLRLHLTSAGACGEAMQRIQATLQPLIDTQQVWKLQTDTYQRELERYGGSLIATAERFFWLDSEMKIRFLQLTEGDEREPLRWPWLCAQIDWLLNCAGYDSLQKEQLLKQLKEGYHTEFNPHKTVLQQMNQQYKQQRPVLESFLQGVGPEAEAATELATIFKAYEQPVKEIAATLQQAAQTGAISINQQLNSYIHMMSDRLFIDKLRMHELVIYNFMHQWYVTERFRQQGATGNGKDNKREE
jgi:lantibiotic biosynthesis protein